MRTFFGDKVFGKNETVDPDDSAAAKGTMRLRTGGPVSLTLAPNARSGDSRPHCVVRFA